MAAGHFQSSTLRKIHWDLHNMLFCLTYVTMGLNKGPTMCSFSFSTGDSHDIFMTKCLFKAAVGFLQQGKSHFHCKINPQKTVIKIKVQGSTTFANKLSMDFAFFFGIKPWSYPAIKFRDGFFVQGTATMDAGTYVCTHACWAARVFGMDDVWG